jgi:cell division protein FtsB
MKKKLGKQLLYAILSFELGCSALSFLCGSQGLFHYMRMHEKNQELSASIDTLNQEILVLEQRKDHWQQHPFYYEKIAREQLQMARSDDYIYYLT